MKLLALINPGIEEISQLEIKELTDSSAKLYPQVLEFEVKTIEESINLIYHLQSARRLLFSLGKFKKIEDIKFDINLNGFDWNDFLASELSLKVEVENVKGQENRFEIAKKVAGRLFAEFKKTKLSPAIDVKKPDVLIIVFFNGKEYFAGIDLAGRELNSRGYRVFPHSASFKGDLAYFFVRKSGFQPGRKLLVGFVKDGTLAIEAGLYNYKLPLQNLIEFKFPKFKNHKYAAEDKHTAKTLQNSSSGKVNHSSEKDIFAFDETSSNIIAARKNALLAKVPIVTQKFSLDELDVKFKEKEFDNLIFYITSKDEDKLNEIYYQANYILKKKGKLFLIGRKDWECSISDKFKLLEEGEICKGESVYKYWLMELKQMSRLTKSLRFSEGSENALRFRYHLTGGA